MLTSLHHSLHIAWINLILLSYKLLPIFLAPSAAAEELSLVASVLYVSVQELTCVGLLTDGIEL